MIPQVVRAIIGSALRAVLALLLLVILLPAVAMVRTAAAKTEEAKPKASTNTNAAAAETNANVAAQDTNVNESLSAETKAQTEELGTAVGGFWKLAWERSWPFIKGVTLKFWTSLSGMFSGIGKIFNEVDTNANVSGVNLVNVNGEIEVQ